MARPKLIRQPVVDGGNLPAVEAQIREAMGRIDYDLPYDRERVVQEARFYMAQSAEAMLEAGRRLLVLKENEPHGEFTEIVQERLGIPQRTAQRMMQSAVKFLLNPALEGKAPLARLGKTKLFELLTEDDEDLAVLAEGGTLAGHTLDEIEQMTKRELQEALREAREETKAAEERIAAKDKVIQKVRRDMRQVADATPDEELERLMAEVTDITNEAVGLVRGNLRNALMALNNHGDAPNTVVMAGLVGQVMADCRTLLAEFSLPEVAPDDETAWATKG
ncbi:Phage protein [plant metagenome]|uniref:Phage protein n=1 Tax=plant metagenome TaxID=1297885 RepID=A0A484UNP0_9ZZZZ